MLKQNLWSGGGELIGEELKILLIGKRKVASKTGKSHPLDFAPPPASVIDGREKLRWWMYKVNVNTPVKM